jgi:formylglycine-generating enzyme required for sulfatase activity
MSIKRYFQAGGTLDQDAPSYIERQADHDLLEALEENELCLVLAPRQTGKSSLMVRTRKKLGAKGIGSAIVDMQQLGSRYDMDKWFSDVVYQIERSLSLKTNAVKWWAENKEIGPTMRFMTFLEDIVLAEINSPLVIFFDEIDTALTLPFSGDFFTTIRALVNARADNEVLKRLNFVLLGVASPTDFIKRKSRTPFNVGTEIKLSDFDSESLKPYRELLGKSGNILIDRILHWTSGQPIMVQKLAKTSLKWEEADRNADHVDMTVRENYLKTRTETDPHLNFIRSYLLESGSDVRKILKTYLLVLKGKTIRHDSQYSVHARLKLAGVLKVDNDDNTFKSRNLIYRSVFGRDWIKSHMPRDIDKMIAVSVSSVLILVFAWFFLIQPGFFPEFRKKQQFSWTNEDIYYTDKSNFPLNLKPLSQNIRRIELAIWDEYSKKYKTIQEKNIRSEAIFEKNTVMQEELKNLRTGENRYRIRYFGPFLSKDNFETLVLVAFWPTPQLIKDLEMIEVPGGCFQMGCGEWAKPCDDNEKPVHEVCLDDFRIGKYELTQKQWTQIMGYNPSSFENGDHYPVENVSWEHVQEFIRRLNKISKKTYRLPTGAEWEYAARSGGKAQKYAGGNDIDKFAWYDENSGNQTHPVGTKAPNGLGIYDMSGNVWEWCEDVYDERAYEKHERNNPLITTGSSFRVIRGGSWFNLPMLVRAAFRFRDSADYRFNCVGFRLCLSQVRQQETGN